MRIAYFTAGTVGAGHLMRGIAIRRGLERAGSGAQYRMFGPPLSFSPGVVPDDYEPVEVRTDPAIRDPYLAAGSDLCRKLDAYRADLLLVDLFWAPMRWVLPLLRCEAWLLVRTCPAGWLVGDGRVRFVASQYQRIVAIEPLEDPAITDTIGPVVIVNPDECRPKDALRARLGVEDERELAVVAHAGERGEIRQLAERDPAAITLDLFAPHPIFPAAKWLPGADRVITGGGYNAFWEARWLRFAERTLFVPFPRSIDDQGKRVRAFADVPLECNGADVLARWIRG